MFLKFLKKFNTNLYIIVVSLLITLWFAGLNTMIEELFLQKNKLRNSIVICLVALFVLYIGDKSLHEIYNAGEQAPIIITGDRD